MMKQIAKIVALSVLVLTLAGCGSSEGSGRGAGGGSTVDQVINDQIIAANGESGASTGAAGGTSGASTPSAQAGALLFEPADYDLTSMNSDMVYATVYQLMAEPDNYIGKTVRMKGLYTAGYYEPTGQYYHYCLIQDALACCAQGLEFVWEDGSHVYPDEYPAENAEIIVQGVFELYQEDGDELLYCHLKDAAMAVVGAE